MPKTNTQNQPQKSSQRAQSSGYLTRVARPKYFLSANLGTLHLVNKFIIRWPMPPQIIKSKFVESVGYWCDVIQIDEDSFVVKNTKIRRDHFTRDEPEHGVNIKHFDKEEDAIDFLEKM